MTHSIKNEVEHIIKVLKMGGQRYNIFVEKKAQDEADY
jgi:hypothetical protein